MPASISESTKGSTSTKAGESSHPALERSGNSERGSRAERVQDAARQIADDTERHEQHRQRERLRVRHADTAKKPDERHLTRSQPVHGHRQQHDQKNERDEREIHREGGVDAQRATEAVRLDHAKDLHRDGTAQHIREFAAEAAVGLGIVIAMFKNKETMNINEIDLMKW